MNSTDQATQPMDRETRVSNILLQLGVPAHIKGYQYLRDAILLTLKEPDLIHSVGKTLYPSVAKEYGTTASGVESAIRKAIELAWERGDIDILNAYFGCTIDALRGKTTPSEFIAQIADQVMLKELNDPAVNRVSAVLRQIGVPADIKGYQYLRDAILLTLKEPDLIHSVGKTLYPSVAKEYGTTASGVESAIRKAIEISYERGDVDTLDAYFGYIGSPTPSEFIARIADHLRQK